MQADSLERLRMEHALRRAVEREELVAVYQPQVAPADGRLLGVEALVRWQRPSVGVVEPCEFVPLAEETGLILPIGEWMLRRACEMGAIWAASRPGPLKVRVNIAASQFRQHDLVARVEAALDASGLDPRLLGLEVTESAVAEDPDAAARSLRRLSNLGIEIALDDFGTGYSSFAYLKRFAIDCLKIPGSFVDNIGRNTDDEAIIRAIVAIAKSVGLRVIAEGVERTEQLDFLNELECDEVQGYLFSRPVSPHEIEPLDKLVPNRYCDQIVVKHDTLP
jgi:EAL domain-containing protein (putative c-di-GMP-specific phosphodiesterase class I)